MKFNLRIKIILCFALLLISALQSYAQVLKHERLLSFEEAKIPSYIIAKNSKINLSTKHVKDGKQALCWSYNANGELSIKKDLHFEKQDPTGVDTYLSSFTMWVYNTKASKNKIEFQFLKDGKKCASFPLNINFTGWRAIYVSYERDMQGTPEEGMNEIKIVAPEEGGEMYFDLIVTAAKVDHRHHTPDVQLPFLNAGIKNHWLTLMENSLVKPDPSLYNSKVSVNEAKEIAQMETKLRELIFTPSKVNDGKIASLKKRFDEYNIQIKDGHITGRSMFFVRYGEAFERLMPNWSKTLYTQRGEEYQKYFNLMNNIAIAYNSADTKEHKSQLEDMFLKMYDHAKDQGVDYGSAMGNFSHYGYSFRGFFTSYFLMKNVLAKTGRLIDAAKALQWYGQTNEVFIRPITEGIDMDAFNTLSMGRICSILIMEDSPEKSQYIRAFSRWIDTGCKPAPGLNGAFKADGGAFHHRNNYPAYAVGGLNGATNMLYILSNTSFAVSELGHSTLKNVLLTMRFYCNTTHFPLSMSGRHPDGRGELSAMHFARMAVAGTPNGKETIDRDMASAYLRLVGGDDSGDMPEYMPKNNAKEHQLMIQKFSNLGIQAEKNPEGNLALGYGCISVQRRNNWSAVVRGHSRYLWAAEHYLGANLYGRYLAHGSMQILTSDDKDARVNPKTSGWLQPGFDWARIPGATAIRLPVAELKANVLNVDVYSGFEEMLYSDEAFAGGLSQDKQNGLFAMKLHEHDKYNGSHRARKSYHFFGNRIVCLGSDIENINKKHNTETTIFQLTGEGNSFIDYWNKYKVDSEYYIDNLGTGYYIPKKGGNDLVFEKNFPQTSRMQNTGVETSGNWVNLVVNHGKAPKGKSYEYVVLPQTEFAQNKKSEIKNSYSVIQKDRNAHIVKDNLSNTTSYAFFETPKALPQGLLAKVDTSCLVMLKEAKEGVRLTVTNPDLALYRGASDEAFDENGKRIERSIYSRPWIGNKSQEIPVAITLNGKWLITNNDGFIKINIQKDKTILEFKCKDAASINVELQPLR